MSTPTRLLWAALVRLGEKTAWTFAEVFLATFAMASSIDGTTLEAGAVAAAAAALTALANGLPDTPAGLPLALDLAYRVVRTTAATALPVIAAVPLYDWTVNLWTGAVLLAGPPVAALLKGWGASKFGARTAATLTTSIELAPTGRIV